MSSITGAVSLGSELPLQWHSFKYYMHDFANRSSETDDITLSPRFTCNGRTWEIEVYPGGYEEAEEGNVSLYLSCVSEGSSTSAHIRISIIDKFGEPKKVFSGFLSTDGETIAHGLANFISRADILDESQNILDSNGTLTIIASIAQDPKTVFVPSNPLVKNIKGMFNDETTADVCFEVVVNGAGDKKGEDGNNTKKLKSSVTFHAHRLILKTCAPMLADVVGSNDTVSIANVKPDIFSHLLFYVYGGEVAKEQLKTHAKDIIDAADKYSIINLKLAAEAAYVESTDITFDNAIDNLLYADAKNCALLKEKVMDYLTDNHYEAAEKISFTDCPGHVMKDLLIAFGRSSKKDTAAKIEDELSTLSVSALRRKLDELGLEVDGSRETMIEYIKSHSSSHCSS